MTVQLPPSFENCFAIGLCAAFEHPPSGLGGLFGRLYLVCSIRLYPYSGLDSSAALEEWVTFALPEKIDQVIPRHIWLIYLRREYFGEFLEGPDKILEIKFYPQIQLESMTSFKTESTGSVHSNGSHEIEENEFDHQTEFKTEGTGLKVNKCGVHFVFKQDIEDLSQTNEMDFFSNGEGSFSDEPGHGEGSSNVMTGTQRIWNLNRIGSFMLRLGNCLGIFCVDDNSACQESV